VSRPPIFSQSTRKLFTAIGSAPNSIDAVVFVVQPMSISADKCCDHFESTSFLIQVSTLVAQLSQQRFSTNSVSSSDPSQLSAACQEPLHITVYRYPSWSAGWPSRVLLSSESLEEPAEENKNLDLSFIIETGSGSYINRTPEMAMLSGNWANFMADLLSRGLG
jgi:hypothetical protein